MSSAEEFFKNIPDPEGLLTSSTALNSITLFEKTVEIVGIVEKVEIRDDLFKFVMHNQDGDRIQVLAWGDDGKRIQGYIKMNFIVHIDGAFAKLKNTAYSNGTLKYDLTIMSNTRVNVLKKLDVIVEENENKENVPVVSIENIVDTKGVAAVQGHLNSSFVQMVLPSGAKLGVSCLISKDYKLEIRIQNFLDDYTNFKENQYVQVTGQVLNNNNIPYILVTSISDIKVLSDSKLKLKELVKGTKVPKRKTFQPIQENDSNEKRFKKET